MENLRHYVLVENSDTALKLYEIVKSRGIKATMAPTPREAEHCCGIAIVYYDLKDKDVIRETAIEAGIKIDEFFDMENIDDPHRNKFC